MTSIIVLTCLYFIGTSSVYGGNQTKLLDALSYFSGTFDNAAQTQQAGDNHEFIQFRNVPVDIECFQPSPVFVGEEVINNTVRTLYLGVLFDGIEDTVNVRIYNFTDYTNFKPGEFKVESLSNISCDDFQGDPDCIASFTIANGFAYGNFPFCSVTVNGRHPRFTALLACDSVTLTTPMYSQQNSTIEPYEMSFTFKKYPLFNKPPGYVSPCGN